MVPWKPGKPKICPTCKTTYWDRPKKESKMNASKIEILAGIALLAALVSPCLAANGIEDSAYGYYSKCHLADISDGDSLTEQIQLMDCVSYSKGLLEGIALVNDISYGQTGHYIFAPQPEATVGQQMMIVIKYMADNPTELSMKTSQVAMRALIKAYPAKWSRSQR
jgi:hypothetical protein